MMFHDVSICFMHSLNTYEMTCWRYLTIEHVAPCPSWSKSTSSSSSPIFPRNFRLIAWPQLWAHRLKGNCIPREQMQRAWDKWMRYTSLLEKLRKPRLKKRDHYIDCSRRQVKQEKFYNSNILQHFATSHNVILQQSSGNTANTIGFWQHEYYADRCQMVRGLASGRRIISSYPMVQWFNGSIPMVYPGKLQNASQTIPIFRVTYGKVIRFAPAQTSFRHWAIGPLARPFPYNSSGRFLRSSNRNKLHRLRFKPQHLT